MKLPAMTVTHTHSACVTSHSKWSVLLLFLFLVVSHVSTSAQGGSAPEVSATVDKVEAYVGDVVSLTVTVDADSTMGVAPLALDTKLGDFEIQEVQRANPVALKDGRKRYQTLIKLWAMETGDHDIPSLTVRYTSADGAEDSLQTAAVTVTVASLVGEQVDSASIKPIREPLEDPLGLDKGLSPLLWASLAALLLLGGGLAWWLVMRKRKEEEVWVDPRPAWEKALDRLAKLQNEPYLLQGQFKEYYSELTDTLREYLGEELQQHTVDMTTSELLAFLENDSLTVVFKPQIADVLTQADMVKFAKATPQANRPTQDFETVYSVIQSIRDSVAQRRREEEERRRELENRKTGQFESADRLDKISADGADIGDNDDDVSSEAPLKGDAEGTSRSHAAGSTHIREANDV